MQTVNFKEQQLGRPISIEDLSNRWLVHPLSDLVARLSLKVGISANLLSVLGLFLGVAAAVFYYFQSSLLNVLAGFACMFAWHVLDGADGKVARASGTASAFGRLIDGICDHVVFLSVYVAFALFSLQSGGAPWIWGLMLFAGISHAVQAAGYEERRQRYQRRCKGQPSRRPDENQRGLEASSLILVNLYDAAQRLFSGQPHLLEAAIDLRARQLGAQNVWSDAAEQTAPMVRAWSILNANNRTFALAVAALFGVPEYYFLYEIVVLNLTFLGLIKFERASERRLAERLAHISR